MKFYHEGDMIYFSDESINKLGYTNFNQELWNTIKNKKFSIQFKKSHDNKEPKYIYCNSLKKSLHQIVIDFYYGEDKRKEMYKKGFIIEHHDNNGFNCLIENLSFLNKKRNTSKAFGFDISRIDFLDNVAINIFKDFKTQNYQITLGFNNPYNLIIDNNEISLAAMYLFYDDNFNIVINDATNILDNFEAYGELCLNKLNFKKYKFKKSIKLFLPEEERNNPIIIKDGKIYFNMDSPYGKIETITPLGDTASDDYGK